MPMYEFLCQQCGTRFEELMDLGIEGTVCPSCGAETARRVYSTPSPPFRLVEMGGEARKQERKNARLRETAKQRLAAARRPRGAGGA